MAVEQVTVACVRLRAEKDIAHACNASLLRALQHVAEVFRKGVEVEMGVRFDTAARKAEAFRRGAFRFLLGHGAMTPDITRAGAAGFQA